LSFGQQNFELLDWLDSNLPRTHFNLASSGVEAPDLRELGIETNPDPTVQRRDLRLEESLGRTYGASASEILVCGGGTMAIFLAIASVVKPGDHVLIPMPNYPPEYGVPRILGARLDEVKMKYENQFRLDADQIASAISKDTKLVILTNSNNPTGLKISRRNLEKISQAAERNGSLVFVDETFREFSQDPAPVARTLGDHVISAGSMTKFYGLGDLRIGWLIAEKSVMERIRSLNKWVSIEISRLCYMIGIQALDKKTLFDERTRRMTKENVSLGREFINKNADYLEWIEPDGAPFGFPKIKMQISSMELCKKLIDDFAILVGPGEFFEHPGHFRLCLTRAPEKTKLALDQLSSALVKISAELG
jgi:aspartate/methionine/tyrosine aminotransferase